MTVPLGKPPLRKPWTQEQFLAWDGHAGARHEFDGFEPVAMTGGTINHGLIVQNLHDALRGRLRGSPCRNLGPDAGLATTGSAIRYPDALVTCSRLVGTALTVPGVVVAFEIVSPTSGRTDRIVKVREYAAVPSVRRYVILESTNVGLTVFERRAAEDPWTAVTLPEEGDILRMPEIAIEVPVGELYAGVDLAEALPADQAPAR